MKSRWALAMAVVLSAAVILVSNAQAIPPFAKVFKETYGGNAAIAKGIEEQKCNVCHKGTKKTEKNAYGIALHDVGAEKKMNDAFKADEAAAAKKFVEILKKAEEKKSASGKTFGELLKDGKLPGAE